MSTIAKITSDTKEYKNEKSGKVTYSRFIEDSDGNKGQVASSNKQLIDMLAVGADLPKGEWHKYLKSTMSYYLKATSNLVTPVSATTAQSATVQFAPVARTAYTSEELDKLLTHYMVMFLDILKDKGVVFTEGMASIPNTWVMTATQQGVKISGSEEIKDGVIQDSKTATAIPPSAPTPGIPITLADARDKALEQSKKLKESKPKPTCSPECAFIIDACTQAAADNNETEEYALRMFSMFKDKQGAEKFIKDIDKLIELDGKGSKWIKSTYRNAKDYMSREHSEMESQDVPDEAKPSNKTVYENLPYDDNDCPF